MLGKNFAAVFLVLAACNSKQVVEDTQCSEAEQAMFLSCVSAGCSASYTQDLSGTDACAVEGGGSIVSVEAGGECGFTSSGSCYVVCDCPEGVGVEATLEPQPGGTTNTAEFEGDRIGECTDSADNDRDGLYDCSDPDCFNSPDCVEETLPVDTGEPIPRDSGTISESTEDEDRDFYTEGDGDCNDRNPSINPEATDVAGDFIDQNCDGVDGVDMDLDGFASVASGGSDCDDFNPVINYNYGLLDLHDFVDSNCDGLDGLAEDYKALEFDFIPGAMKTGDFDGDGLDDLIIQSSGIHYLFYGSSLSTMSSYLSFEDANAIFHLDNGSNPLVVNDLDEDGYDDLIGHDSGSVYVFKGTTISSNTNLIPDYNHDAKFYTSEGGAVSLSRVQNDLNSDGSKELLVGGYLFDIRSSWTDNRVHSLLPTERRMVHPGVEAGDSDLDGYLDYFQSYYRSGSGYYGWYSCLRDWNTHTSSCIREFSRFIPTQEIEDTDGDGYLEVGTGSCYQNINSITDDTTCDVYLDYNILPGLHLDSDTESEGTQSDRIILSSAEDYVDYRGGIYTYGDYNGDGQMEIVSHVGIVGMF